MGDRHYYRFRCVDGYHGLVPWQPSLLAEADSRKVVSFPVTLLWKVRMNMRQKLGLGSSLCLSFVMVIVAVIRISGARLPSGLPDFVWLSFWQQQECSIAVTMVSLAAFRSLFVTDASRQAMRPKYTSSYWKQKKMAWNRRKCWQDLDNFSLGSLPVIPSATMTGLRTFIREEPNSDKLDEAEEHRSLILAKGHPTYEV